MIKLKTAFGIIIDLLEKESIPYMVFGGIANSIYGYSRQTYDIDIKIILDIEKDWPTFSVELEQIGKIIPESPKDFIKDTKVLPVEINHVRVDLVIAELPYEINAINNSIESFVFDRKCRVCTAEDLIIQKSISEREKDWLDISEIIKIQKDRLDWEYIFNNCRQLSEFLSDLSIYENIKKLADEK